MGQFRPPWKRGRRWVHALLFGLPQGALLFAILLIALIQPDQLPQKQAIGIAYALSFFIPIIAGFSIGYRRRHEGWESGWAGLRVGLLASALFMLTTSAWLLTLLVIADNSPAPPPSPENPRGFYSPGLALMIDLAILVYLAFLSAFIPVISAAGGRIGGTLAILLAKRLQQSPEHDVLRTARAPQG